MRCVREVSVGDSQQASFAARSAPVVSLALLLTAAGIAVSALARADSENNGLGIVLDLLVLLAASVLAVVTARGFRHPSQVDVSTAAFVAVSCVFVLLACMGWFISGSGG